MDQLQVTLQEALLNLDAVVANHVCGRRDRLVLEKSLEVVRALAEAKAKVAAKAKLAEANGAQS